MPLIKNSIIDKIFAETEIEDVVRQYVDLKKKGSILEACCPFHDEKTPSFVVNPAKGFFKCFGCGEGGNAFQFVQKYEKLSAYDTYVKLAELLDIKLEFQEEDKEYKEKREQQLSMQEIIRWSAEFYNKNLPHHPAAGRELKARNVGAEDVKKWQLGFADNSNAITGYLKDFGKLEEGINLDIIRRKEGLHYDYFRNRITIPIIDSRGNVIAFGAKSLNGEKPKYINSADSELYNKSKVLFGLFQAQEAIRKRRKAYLNEGYFDVISMSRAGISNVVATCGTALTDEQCRVLKKHTGSIVIFYDGDTAGRKASFKALDVLLRHSFQAFIVTGMPDGMDPDDIVRWVEECYAYFSKNAAIDREEYFKQFEAYIEENIEDALLYLSKQLYNTAETSFEKGEAICRIAETISSIPNLTTKQEYIKELSDILKVNKTTFKKEVEKFDKDRLDKIRKENPDADKDLSGPQTEEALDDYRRFGFWADERHHNYGYHFAVKNGNERVSNFLLESLYLIQSHNDSKRIFRIKNDNNVERIMELPIDALTGLSKFQASVERLGKFIFEGNQSQVNKLKHKLYEQEKTCFEIKNLGWHKAKFWAFANGIFFDNDFQEIDNHGIVIHNDVNYFIPALSQIYSGDETRLKNDKKFIHIKKSKVKFDRWAKLFREVHNYADHYNGDVAILFTCAAIFRDVVFNNMGNSFPLLFLFGPPGTGKNQLAYGLLHLFGLPQDQVPLNSNTKPGLTKRMAEFSNAVIFLDEYHNGLEDNTIQFLKSIFDGQSRTKSEMTSDDKTTSTPIRSSAIVAGQEKPISSGGALFSRCMFLQFSDRQFNKEKYLQLDDMQKAGITAVLLEILSHRNLVEMHFKTQMENALKNMHRLIDAYNLTRSKHKQEALKVMDRLLNSYCAALAIYYVLSEVMEFPYTSEEIESNLFTHMKRQSGMITKSNDVSVFWEYIQALFYANGPNRLEEGKHFKIGNKTIGDKVHTALYLQFSSVHMLYQKEYRQHTGKPAMDKSSLMDYLKNSPEFLGTEASTRFKDEYGTVTNNSAYVFDYDKLSKFINLVKEKNGDETPGDSDTIQKLF